MKAIQKTSLLLCFTILVVFGALGIVVKWPVIEQWYQKVWDTPDPQAKYGSISTDPFNYHPPLPSYVLDLHAQYTIQAELFPVEAKLAGTATIEFDNPNTEQIYIYSYPYQWSPMKIHAIRYEQQALGYQRHDPVIVLANPAGSEKRIRLTVTFETPVPRKPSRFGVSDDIWTLTNWYPMLGALNPQKKWYEPPQPLGFGDPYVYQYADYDVTFYSPEKYQWVTSWGIGTDKKLSKDRKELRFAANNILNFSMVGSPHYKIESLFVEPNLTVYIASTNAQNIRRIKDIAQSAFTAYTNLQGELPYPQVAIAETGPKTVFAMEYANLAIFSRDMYANNQIDHWLPHEIAHLWWYNSVGNVEPAYGWIDEGLVESSVYFYKKHRYGPMAANALLKEYQADYDKLKKHYPNGKLSKHLTQLNNDERFWTWYAKGALLYQNLRTQIGEEKFSEFLKRLQRYYHGKLIGPEHLDQALSQTLKGEARYFVPNADKVNTEPFAPVSLNAFVDLSINGISYYPSLPPRIWNHTVYIPLRELMEKVGYEVVAHAAKGVIELNRPGERIVLREKSAVYTRNGKPGRLRQPLLELDDRAMAPLEFYQHIWPGLISYDETNRIVKISTRGR